MRYHAEAGWAPIKMQLTVLRQSGIHRAIPCNLPVETRHRHVIRASKPSVMPCLHKHRLSSCFETEIRHLRVIEMPVSVCIGYRACVLGGVLHYPCDTSVGLPVREWRIEAINERRHPPLNR